MNKRKIIEITILFLFLTTIILFIASYKINYLDLDKIGILIFFLSAFINGIYWKNIILDLNTSVSSLKEATNIVNNFSKKNSSWSNYMIRLKFEETLIQEYKFKDNPQKNLVSAVVFIFKEKSSVIPLLLIPLIPMWFYGIDKFMYERYYKVSPIIHDTFFYIGLIGFTYILWISTSFSISLYILKRELK